MTVRENLRNPSLSVEEARLLHLEALVIDSQQPPATSGFLFTDNMRSALNEYYERGMTRGQASVLLSAQAAREIQTSVQAREQYLDFWAASGVNIACGTYAGPGPFDQAFETSVTGIAQARSIVDALHEQMTLVLKAEDIEKAYREGKYGLIIDFQNFEQFWFICWLIGLFGDFDLQVSPVDTSSFWCFFITDFQQLKYLRSLKCEL